MSLPPAMPAIFIDANILHHLFTMEQQVAAGKLIVGKLPSEILEDLCEAKKATLIIPRTIFNESTNWSIRDEIAGGDTTVVRGYLDLTSAGDMPLNSAQMNWPENRAFVEWLQEIQAEGKLRVARDLRECYSERRELSRAKGGVVLLNSGLVHDLRAPDAQEVVTASIQTLSHHAPRTEFMVKPAQSGIGKGDAELAYLGRTVAAYARDRNRAPRYLVLSDDKEAKSTVRQHVARGSDGHGPVQMNLLQLLTALHRGGSLSDGDYRAYCHGYAEKLGIQTAQTLSANFERTVAEGQAWLAERGIVTEAPPQRMR